MNTYTHGNTYAQGVAVDNAGNVWVAHSLIGPQFTVGHLRTDGTYVGNVALPGGTDRLVWPWTTTARFGSLISIRTTPCGLIRQQARGPDLVTPIGAVDCTVDLGLGAGPYNYSDMTGGVGLSGNSSGTWNVVRDGGKEGTEWGTVTWNGEDCANPHEPAGTSLSVRIRAADTQVAASQNRCSSRFRTT